MTTQATAPGSSGHGMGEEGSTSSPYSMHGIPSSSTPVSHNFNIDSFDFGADFSLPSSLDDLAIFHNHNGTVIGQHPSSASQGGGSQASPVQGTSFGHGRKPSLSRSKSHNVSASGNRSSNNSAAGSPRSNQYSSPRVSMREQVLHQATNSRHQSPHAFSSMNPGDGTDLAGVSSGISANGGGSTEGSHGSNAGGGNSTLGYNNFSLDPNDLQGLLQSINASSLSQQEHQQQIQEGNLSIGELQKLLTEKEQMERAQSIQTAFLRQQLEALQRQSSNSQNEDNSHQAQSQSMTGAMSASQLMQQFQQLSSQQQSSSQGSRGNQIFSPSFPQLSSSTTGSLPSNNSFLNQSKPGQTMGMSVAMNQYGLITPASSSAFSQTGRGQAPFVSPLHIPGSSQMQPMMDPGRSMTDSNMMPGSFTPLESPAITPASVFSNVGSTATSADLFSPLTSPALHPQMHSHDGMIAMQLSPFHGPTQMKGRGKGRGIPGASPVTNPTKSIPRKNRSTTAEARANRARASPIVKPTISTSTSSSQTRKRGESGSGNTASPLGSNVPTAGGNGNRNGSAPTSRRTSQSESNDGKQTPQAFPPLSAGSGIAKPMDASPSETAASTPSPIEMPPPNGKPMTPSSAMGIQSTQKKNARAEDTKTQSNWSGKNRSNKSSNESGNGKQVSFADSNSTVLQNILPGGLSDQDRESWASTMKSSGGGGLESRRTSHKAAEQKRRDSLKFCFDELRGMLPAITLDDDVPGGSMLGPDGYIEDQESEGFTMEEVGDAESARIANRAISKVALLRHSNEYLIRLKHRMGRRDRDLALCRREIMELRSRLGLPISPEMPALTASIAGAAASMGHNMNGLLGMDQMIDPSQNPHQAAIVTALQQHMQLFQNDQLGPFAHVMANSNSMDTST